MDESVLEELKQKLREQKIEWENKLTTANIFAASLTAPLQKQEKAPMKTFLVIQKEAHHVAKQHGVNVRFGFSHHVYGPYGFQEKTGPLPTHTHVQVFFTQRK